MRRTVALSFSSMGAGGIPIGVPFKVFNRHAEGVSPKNVDIGSIIKSSYLQQCCAGEMQLLPEMAVVRKRVFASCASDRCDSDASVKRGDDHAVEQAHF